jgi:hypothetical protein
MWNHHHRQTNMRKINQLMPEVCNISNETNFNKYGNIEAPLNMGAQWTNI